MYPLEREKSLSCHEMQISINGVPVSPNEQINLYFNQHGNFTNWRNNYSSVQKTNNDNSNNGKKESEKVVDLFKKYLRIANARRKYLSANHVSDSAFEDHVFDSAKLVNMVDHSVIGRNVTYNGPFGPRQIIYLDHTASGKSLKCIEDFIQENVLPYYANTHTVSSFTSIQTTTYREEAREYIRKATGAESEDVIIFHGSGTTSCIHKLIHHALYGKDNEQSIVFVGPFEHHSNILPWREAGVHVVNIPVNKYGHLDIKYLKMKLKEFRNGKGGKDLNLIGCFSVASNVTGIVSDDIALTILMHKYGGLAFFDYAAGAPHAKITMNPKLTDQKLSRMAEKDALYFSGHKFMGGPQTTGVLVAKKNIFKNPVPHGQGGGTVNLVTSQTHSYVKDISEREEGGTPGIVENIRLGLVMKLKMEIGEESIVAREANFTKRAFQVWSQIANLIILGDTQNPRIPIISFLIEHPQSGYYLHHNFVATVMNDLFGIQSRGGCMCAGPYSQILLGVNEELALDYEHIFARSMNKTKSNDGAGDDLIFKPGFTRLSFAYHASLEEVDYTIEAVSFLAEHGWKLLPYYKCNMKMGSFTFANPTTISRAKSLNSCHFGLNLNEERSSPNMWHPSYQQALNYAFEIARKVKGQGNVQPEAISPNSQKLRWFLLPSEANELLQDHTANITAPRVFEVRKTQFKVTNLKQLRSKTYEGSVLHQIFNSVWTDEHHEMTEKLVAQDVKLRRELDACAGGHKLPGGTSYSSDSGSIDSQSSGFADLDDFSSSTGSFRQDLYEKN